MSPYIALALIVLAVSSASAQFSRTTKTVYVQAGAADIIQLDEFASSHYKLGKTVTSGDTVYDRATNQPGQPQVLGLSARFCTQIYLDRVFDAAAYAVVDTYPNYGNDHERHYTPTDNSKAGFGTYECSWVISLADGTIALKGELERRYSVASVLAITGGTGAYVNVRGSATLTTVNSNKCANDAFKASSVPSDCQYKIEMDLVTVTRVYGVTAVTLYEYAGAQELTQFDEVAASRFKLGNREVFGNPVKEDSNSRVGYSGGVYYPVYLSSSDAGYAAASSTTGAHPRPGAAGQGLRLAELSLVYYPSGDTLSLQGVVESDLSLPSTVAIVGGTGRYQNAKGSAIRTTVDPARCAAQAFKNTSVPKDCIFRYDLSVIVDANDPYDDIDSSFVFYEYGGSTVSINFAEVYASNFRLGASFYFGGPLKNDIPERGGVRTGYDGGYCWKVYLDAAWDYLDIDRPTGVKALDGAHTRPGGLKWEGAWMCYWTSHYLEGSITQMGIFGDSVFLPNIFSVVGGKGAYSNSTGFMYDDLNNADNCYNYGFTASSPVEACLYRKRYSLLSLPA